MSSNSPAQFTFVDLFAGIGGFHAALGALGGECVYAVENDPAAAAVYQRNWRMPALGDITEDSLGGEDMVVPEHDVLAAGFPCQPFSKSGFQRGMDEARGTLFWNILEVLRVRRPTVVLLENVRNIAGPRHTHEWEVIIRSLRELGYRVSSKPLVFSPHLLPPERGGRPQVRERVFILGTYVGPEHSHVEVDPAVPHRPVDGWDPQDWSLEHHLPLEDDLPAEQELRLRLSPAETTWVEAWNDFVVTLRAAGVKKLPGFPIWVDFWVHEDDLDIPEDTPPWKAGFLRKNSRFYTEHQATLELWKSRWNGLADFPPSRRKFEWQAQHAASLDDTILHFRPSGVRAKRATYTPALVAITQTSILGDRRRRLSPREVARLQGLPDWFDFGDQPDAATYKQVGNGVNVGAAHHVFREHVLRDLKDIQARAPGLVAGVVGSAAPPDETPIPRARASDVPTLGDVRPRDQRQESEHMDVTWTAQTEEPLWDDAVIRIERPSAFRAHQSTTRVDGSGSPEFNKLRHAFAQDPGLRQETEWAFRLAVETYNPSDRGLRFITGAIGEWILTLAAYRAGLVTLPDGHGADGHDTIDVLGEARALWSVKTSYKPGGYFTITNGQGGPGAGLVVPTVFLSPELPGVVFVDPEAHPEMVAMVQFGKDSSKLTKAAVRAHAEVHPDCVIDLAMPTNPGAAVRDPALEAVKILVDTVNFPRLRGMFVDIASRSDSSLVSQIRDLKRLLENGTLNESQYRAAINRLTGAVS